MSELYKLWLLYCQTARLNYSERLSKRGGVFEGHRLICSVEWMNEWMNENVYSLKQNFYKWEQ